ncbi:MAG: hypothetical protein M1840_009067 [Geoglossum simile]|nr:MAG: hypothetical protein M1840_009067 [Geoglossum simile]
MPYAEPHSQTSTRHFTCISKPSARKRANSESISQPSYSSQHRRKPFRATLPPAPPRQQRAAIIDVDEANTGDDAGESFGEDEDEDKDKDEYQDASEYAREDKEGGENENFVQHIIEDELEDEAEKDKDTMTYLSIWKAIVNNKEVLCSKLRLFTADLTIYSIQCWQREVLEHAAPRQLEVIRLQAVASYECCRAMDEYLIELRGQRDIYDVTEILRIWHK